VSSATGHFLIGAALALPAVQSRELTALLPRWFIPVSSGLLAAIPDLDLAVGRLFGIPDDSFFAHRGFFHSPFFLILYSGALAALVTRGHFRQTFGRLWLLWGLCMVTHPLMDALTNGGNGVMLLVPFSRARLFFPWRPLYTPPGGIESLISRAWILRSSEIPLCVTAAEIGVAGLLARRWLWTSNG
jgi:inner membrane protein